MKPKVFVTRKIARQALDLISKECDLEVFPEDRPIRKEELLAAVKDKDGILVLVTDPVDKDIIGAGKNLKVISNYGEGINHIDIKAASERGILVANTPSSDIADAVAETTIGLMLTMAKRIPEADKAVRRGLFRGWTPMDWWGAEISHKMIGIVGLGRIGSRVAERLKGWNVNICYYDVARKNWAWENEKSLGVIYVCLETLLRESDFITLHVDLNEKTHHLIGEKELSLMKPTAFLINTCRGPVVDEKMLHRFLKEKKIAGAALDVYENEPKLTPGLKKLKNVVLTPHLAGATASARVKPAIMAAENLLKGLELCIKEKTSD